MDVSAIHSSLPLQTQAAGEQVAGRRELFQAAKIVNVSGVLGAQNEVTFVIDRASHRAIMRVVDRATHEIVMQLPPEYMLELAKDLEQKS